MNAENSFLTMHVNYQQENNIGMNYQANTDSFVTELLLYTYFYVYNLINAENSFLTIYAKYQQGNNIGMNFQVNIDSFLNK